ncbi:MAG TPA: HK97 family phage prohead protease [Vitreimonas sp.]|nr:HK97 family phage prohead protease [Vitreimonas sp.]
MSAIAAPALDAVREDVLAREAASAPRRTAALDEIEFRDAGDKLIFTGHAAVFDRLSDDLGGFRERIQRGAFRKVLDRSPDVRFLVNHDSNLVLARTTVIDGPGLLELREDPKGLRVYSELVPTTQARDLRELVKAGVITQMSFSFRIYPDGTDIWEEVDGELIRTIVSFSDLFDVGPVTFPAYPQTDASMRSRVCGIEIVDGEGAVLEEHLRDLAWKIHRGDLTATVEDRAALDAAFARTNTVSPWTAERALRAASQEPELRAAIPGKTATVVLEDAAPSGGSVPYRLAARQRRLRALGTTSTAKEHTP